MHHIKVEWFFINSIGEYGLVAALEDLGDNNPVGYFNLQIQGADKTFIGGANQTLKTL